MNWEEYENSDWYRESHPNWNEKPSREEKIADEMRRYLFDMDEYKKKVQKEIERQEKENDGDVKDECLLGGILPDDYDNEERIVRYVTKRLWNGRFRGILKIGSYEQCLFARYEYNVACIDSEWDWACIERIEAKDEDDLEDIIVGYHEAAQEAEIYGDDYDY